MTSLNKVFLAGNLTRDPEVKYFSSGTPLAKMGLAVNEVYKNKAGEQVKTTCFVDVEIGGRQAETCGQYLHKGSPVLIEGRLKYDEWQSKEGEKRNRLLVRADRVQFLSARPKTGEPDGEVPQEAVEDGPGPRMDPPPTPPPPPAPSSPDEDDLPF